MNINLSRIVALKNTPLALLKGGNAHKYPKLRK